MCGKINEEKDSLLHSLHQVVHSSRLLEIHNVGKGRRLGREERT